MKAILAAIAKGIAEAIIKAIGSIRHRMVEGYSDGTTEKELKKKARKDGWDA
jgi:hypothetical protein